MYIYHVKQQEFVCVIKQQRQQLTYHGSVPHFPRKHQLLGLSNMFAIQHKAKALTTATIDWQLLHQQRTFILHTLPHQPHITSASVCVSQYYIVVANALPETCCCIM